MLPLILLHVLVATIGASVRKELQTATRELKQLNLLVHMWKEYVTAHPSAAPEDAHLSFVDLVKKYNYPIESHYVTTPDGYILNIFRIPYGRNVSHPNRPVAFLQHGLISSSDDWITPGPKKSLGYLLADKGYDVWFGNARGNVHSRNHTTLDPDDRRDTEKFWNFSWNEIGTIDTPAMIDYVLEKAGQESLFHVGHSQGTTTYYVMTSEKPEYNKKIRAHFSLSPIAFMGQMPSLLFQHIAQVASGLNRMFELTDMYEFLPTKGFIHQFSQSFCKGSKLTVCAEALFVVFGFSPGQMNYTLFPVILGHTPGGASTKQFIHYLQEIKSGEFRKFENKWGHSPAYDLSKITAPLYMFYSTNDWVSSAKDVDKLYNKLINVNDKDKFSVTDFNHLDYLFGKDAETRVYTKIISLMTKH